MLLFEFGESLLFLKWWRFFFFHCPLALDSCTGFLQDGVTALHIASQNGHEDAVQLLLEQGAAVDLVTQARNQLSLSQSLPWKLLGSA